MLRLVTSALQTRKDRGQDDTYNSVIVVLTEYHELPSTM